MLGKCDLFLRLLPIAAQWQRNLSRILISGVKTDQSTLTTDQATWTVNWKVAATLREGRFCDIDIERLAPDLRAIMLDVVIGELPEEQHFLSAERLRQDVIPLVSAMMFAIGYGDYNGKKRYNSMHSSCFEFLAEFLDGVDGQSPELRAPPYALAQKFAEQMVREAQTHATPRGTRARRAQTVSSPTMRRAF
jgi:hypothetical protein